MVFGQDAPQRIMGFPLRWVTIVFAPRYWTTGNFCSELADYYQRKGLLQGTVVEEIRKVGSDSSVAVNVAVRTRSWGKVLP